MIFAYYIQHNPCKYCILFIKKERKWFLAWFYKILALIFFLYFFGIYNKFVKFLNDLINISITL